MTLVKLTLLILHLNHAIDTGKYQDISVEEAEDHIRAGDLFVWLQDKLGNDIDLSLHTPVIDLGAPEHLEGKEATEWIKGQVSHSKQAKKTQAEIIERLQGILEAYGGDERRKWGVQNSGLCLLLAWVNELVQQEEWER